MDLQGPSRETSRSRDSVQGERRKSRRGGPRWRLPRQAVTRSRSGEDAASDRQHACGQDLDRMHRLPFGEEDQADSDRHERVHVVKQDELAELGVVAAERGRDAG